MKDSYDDLTKPIDEWLWIPYKKWLDHFLYKRYYLKHTKKERLRTRLATRQTRKRKKEKIRNDLIQSIYWHEIRHPTIPIRQYK